MRRQLALGAAALTTTVALAFLVPLALMVRSVVDERAVARADLVARSVAPLIAVTDDPRLVEGAVAALTRPEAQIGVHLGDGRHVGAPPPAPEDLAASRAGRAFVVRDAPGATALLPVEGAAPDPAVVSVFVPAGELRRGVERAWALLALLGLALVVLAVVLADRLATRIVLPVRALADAARRLGEGDLDARVHPQGPPEIAEVGRVTNHLAERIGDLLVRERELVADLSHRLRTPLASLRLDAEQLPASAASDRVRDDVDLLERDLTRLIKEARRAPQGSPAVIDLAAVVRERVEFWAALAEEQGRPWSAEIPDQSVPVTIDPQDAQAALDALLGNVFAHTPDHAACHIELAGADADVCLAVRDAGPGFPAEALARGRSGADSTGLGLDIARRVAEGAGGRLEAGNEPGGGACVGVHLPLAGFTEP